MKRLFLFFIVVLLPLSFVSCIPDDSKKDNGKVTSTDTTSIEVNGNDETSGKIPQGEPVPTFNVDWPSEMLPDDFPNLGKVTKIYDSRSFVKRVTINWNIVSEEQVGEIIVKLNEYLDLDHAWQDGFYSDGIKYISGTENEYIRIVVRYMKSASGELEPEFKPQFYLEISGPGIPDK